ncbi:hypothetical protein JTL84_15400 [Pseudomonas aeruginosa]|uniref:hypothetical protein n=1 Tax=Pseudomonas aeruginosa TaxID=287 RepID=UPI00187E2AE8|nr:hypothetical protein [Pseudomonas aeruginosa]MBM9950447.1 hypothetical protein [Pseudomonas aeruginosa]
MNVLLRRLKIDKVSQIAPALAEMAGHGNTTDYSKFRADFYRYKAGENIKNESLATEIDRLLPGTARIVNHPLWSFLSICGAKEIELIELAQKLEPSLNQYLLKYDEGTCAISFRSLSKNHGCFKAGSKFLRTIDRRGLDDLAALLIGIKSHELRCEYYVSFRLRELVLHFFMEISLMPEFNGVVEGLYKETHGVLADLSYEGKYGGEGCFMSAKRMAREDPVFMLDVIKKISSSRASHVGKYSEILRRDRAFGCTSGD